MSVNTGKVKDRRSLRFNSIDEMMADAERIAGAERTGTLRRTGNWTAGQTFGHLAAWMNYPYDGYPPQLAPPWFVRWFVKLQRRRFFETGMPAGISIPRVPGGTAGIDPLPLDEGLSRLRAAAARMTSTAPSRPNPLFGPLSHQEWIAMNCRHAELHLSFLHP